MSNFISIITRAYCNNFIDEAREANESFNQICRSWREPANEVDIAKVVGFTAKVFGTISLGFFALSALNLLQKRTVSLCRLFFTASWFLGAAELLQAGNNLRFEYSMTAQEKAEKRKAENQGGWFLGLRSRASHVLSKTTHSVRSSIEASIIEDPSTLEDFRATRVLQVAVKDTYVLGPLLEWL